MARNLITGDRKLKGIKPGGPDKRINDGGGLYLLLFVKGGAHGWRFAYTHGGKRLLLSLGTYPDTGLALARVKADDARKLLAAGTDPSATRKASKEAQTAQRVADKLEAAGLPGPGTFEFVAREWLANIHAVKVSAGHAERTRGAPINAATRSLLRSGRVDSAQNAMRRSSWSAGTSCAAISRDSCQRPSSA